MTRRLIVGLSISLLVNGVLASTVVAQSNKLTETHLIQAVSTALNTAFGKHSRHRFRFDGHVSLAHIGRDSTVDGPRWSRELALPRGARAGHVRDYFDCPTVQITPACQRTAGGSAVYVASVDAVTVTSMKVRVIV